MTLPEKISQLGNNVPDIARLGVRAYAYSNEACHGVVGNGTTMFPQAIGLSATWDPDLEYQIASAISDEARGLNNLNGKGLTYWAPTVNMCRDPRWGRNEESYGEDPFLARQFAVQFVKGMQGDDPIYLKTIATVKHFACNNIEYYRSGLSSNVDERSLREYYLPVFKAAVIEGHVRSIMSAYNSLNGVPCSGNKTLLTDILRKEWGFTGYVVSDCGAIDFIQSVRHYTATLPEAAVIGCKAGCDLNCGTTYQQYFPVALQTKLWSFCEADIDTALKRIFKARFLLGEFDPSDKVPYKSISPQIVGSAKNQSLSLFSAQESMVLLKNDSLLPLDTNTIHSIAVIGPNANVCRFGGYSGTPVSSVSPLRGLLDKLGPSWKNRIAFVQGCGIADGKDLGEFDRAVNIAFSADAVIMFMGTDNEYVGEGRDLWTLNLPGVQEDLIEAVYSVNRKIVLVLINGNPLSISWPQTHVPAILEAWYAGQSQGTAIAGVLFGDYNPGGKLTATWVKSVDDLPDMQDYNIFNNRTYMHFTGKPLYPFGFGLSYSTFDFSNLAISPEVISPGKSVLVSLDITNTGKYSCDEVPQLYVHDRDTKEKTAQKQLKGFKRVSLEPGKSQTVQFTIPYEELAHWDMQSHSLRVTDGVFDIMTGSSSEDIKLSGKITATGFPDTSGMSKKNMLPPGKHFGLHNMPIRFQGPGPHRAEIIRPDGRTVKIFESRGPALFTWQSKTSGVFLLKLTEGNSTRTQTFVVAK
jgi:Beta-glucosidase-related glycosidases